MPKRRLDRTQIAKAFGVALVQARTAAGMTQEQLADSARLHRTTVGLLERGIKCPTLDTVFHLAHAMGSDPVELVSEAAGRIKKS
ncbi:helix-turn-helix transcriptional regulator [Planctomycetales bacterium ZRK34]|nr:helix-turn-helix transcriptional regulator [Planctomycetales bacterium ZRK34]